MLKQDEYTNQFLGAIDLMIEHAMSRIKMDRVIVCTIIDNTYAKTQGKYKVSDGTVKFDAQSEYTDYRVDEQVRVQVSADTEEKFIIGKYTTADSEKPITYIPPLGDVLQMRSYDDTAVYPFTLTGPDEQRNPTPKSQQIFDNRKLDDDIQTFLLTDIYDTIFLSVDIQTLLSSYNIVSGEYGFRIELYTQLPDGTPGPTEPLYFGSKEMMGNPYSFSIFTNQAAKFSMSNLDLRITGFSLWITQDGNFQYLTSKNTIEPIEVFDDGSNIKVKNITIGFGNYLYTIEDNTVKLVTADPLTYSVDDKKKIEDENGQEQIILPQKTLELIWYNKDENGKYIGFTDGKVEKEIEGSNKDIKMSFVSIGEDLIKFVDEESYQKVVAKDNRLKNQWSYDVPIDVNGLEFAAKLQELKDKLNQINDYLSRDYWQTVNNALYEIKEASPENLQTLQKLINQGNFLASLTNKNSEYESSSQEEKNFGSETILELYNYYKDFLAKCAAAANPPLLTSDESTAANYEEKILKYKKEIKPDATIDDDTKWQPEKIKDYFYGENDKSGLVGLLENIHSYSKLVLADLETKDFPEKQKKIDYYRKALNKNIKQLEDFIFDSKSLKIAFPFDKGNLIYLFSYYNPDPSRERKIFSDYPEYSNGYCVYWQQYNPEEGKWENVKGSGYTKYSTLSVGLDTDRSKEKYKVSLYFNHVEYSSKELEFTIDKPTEELIEKGDIRIVHGEDSKEAYQCYLSNGLLADKRESSVTRELFAQFIGNDGYVNQDFFKDSQITWTIPLGSSTMLTYNEDWMKDKGFTIVKDETNNIVSFYKSFLLNEEIDSKFYYMIKSFYSPQAKNNTIICTVSKSVGETVDIYDKTTSISINFTSFGNSGTDYTLIVFSETPQRGLTSDNTIDDPWELMIKLYDSFGKEMEFPGEITTSIIGGGEDISSQLVNNKCQIYYNYNEEEEKTKTSCGILRVSVANVPRAIRIETNDTGNIKTIDLTTYFPIPYSSNQNYQISGPDIIIYDSYGANPQYNKDGYQLYEWSTEGLKEKAHISYMIDPKELKYLTPTLKDNNLFAAPMYITGEGIEGEIFPIVELIEQDGKVLWKQPILIMQNKYSSPMINGWDGELKIDKDKNTILSAMMGAGKKVQLPGSGEDNLFSGVLFGDVESTVDHSGIGMYGFHEGAQSFGFNVDGTAFLGKASGGRIHFDGNNGYIYSSNWVNNINKLPEPEDGIYYKNNNIIIYQPENTTQIMVGYYNENGELTDPQYEASFEAGLFTWKETDGTERSHRIYKAGKSVDGMHIDLQNGQIDAYNFKLSSKNILLDSSGDTRFEIKSDDNSKYIRLDNAGNLEFELGELNATATKLNIIVPDPKDLTKNIFKLVAVPDTSSRIFELVTDNFSITEDGVITATNGTIGGWTLSETGFSYDNNTYYFGPTSISGQIGGTTYENLILKAGSNFGIGSGGQIYSSSGNVGGWYINSSQLKSQDGAISLSPANDIVFKAGDNFKVEKNGTLHATNAKLSGEITADQGGAIGTWKINNSYSFEPSDVGLSMSVGNAWAIVFEETLNYTGQPYVLCSEPVQRFVSGSGETVKSILLPFGVITLFYSMAPSGVTDTTRPIKGTLVTWDQQVKVGAIT